MTTTGNITVLRRGDDGYEQARLDAVWNGRKPGRFPAAIVLARSSEDVAAAVRLAAAEGLRVGIRSGGHSFVGNGVREGGLLIDMSALNAVGYDPDSGLARVEPRATGPEVNAVLARHGRFFPTGHAPTVGLGGFTLGGGYGWNSRRWGPACLGVEAIDVVLADGTFVHATDATHPDLLWAARGSGPGFCGVVTAFYLRTYPVYARMLRTAHVYPGELRDEVLAWTMEVLPQVADVVEPAAKLRWTPDDGEHVVVTATAFLEAGSDPGVLETMNRAPMLDRALRSVTDVETDLDTIYRASDASTPAGFRWSFDGIWCDAPMTDVLPASRPMFEGLPHDGLSFVFWMLWGNYPEQENACWSVQAPLYLSPNGACSDPADDLRTERWVHGGLAGIQHLSVGTQFSDANLADRWDHGLSPVNAARVEEIRASYDPDGRFHTFMRPEESTTAFGLADRAGR